MEIVKQVEQEREAVALEELVARLEGLEKQVREMRPGLEAAQEALARLAHLEEALAELRRYAEQMAQAGQESEEAELEEEEGEEEEPAWEEKRSLLGISKDRAGEELTEEIFLEVRRSHFDGL